VPYLSVAWDAQARHAEPAQHHPDDGLVPGGHERRVAGVGSRGPLVRNGASMQALLNDLVDFNRTNLGLGCTRTEN
jgi:hypothetical protein